LGKGLKKDERTADLKTVFTEVKGHVNPHTAVTQAELAAPHAHLPIVFD